MGCTLAEKLFPDRHRQFTSGGKLEILKTIVRPLAPACPAMLAIVIGNNLCSPDSD